LLKKYNITFEGLLIILIVILAAFLRFWNFGRLPFMHDEFSAIFRTWYDSLSQVIEIGVKQNDSHPAGVQLFIYFWIKIFGLSEPLLKLPFALMGTGSVAMVWLIGKRWFNETAALFTSLLMAVTQYNIFYSQLARPYAAGLFFTLVAAWFWTKVVFDEKPKKSDWILFVLFVAANSYIHAFTLFFNLMMGATGLLFVRGKRLKHYLLAGLAVFVLFIPGIPVFMAQLGRGDIGGWLSVPKPTFLLNYFFYLFHFSRWFLITTLAILLFLSIKYFNRNEEATKFRIIGIAWFVTTFLVACLYSVFRSPILQYSTLLFVFPFFMLTMFSFISRLPKGTLTLALVLVAISAVFTLVFERQHYVEMYNQGFDQIPAQVIRDLKKYGDKKVGVVLQAPDTRMFDYYFKKYNNNPGYFRLEKNQTLTSVNDYLEKDSVEVVLFGWADYAPLSYLESLKAAYPFVVKKMSWFNSEYWVLSKKTLATSVKKKEFELLALSGKYFVFPKNKYGKAIVMNVDTLAFKKYDVLNVQVAVEQDSVVPNAMLVLDWRDDSGEPVYWAASDFKKYHASGSVYYVTVSMRLMNLPKIPTDGAIKFYIWKKDNSRINIRWMRAYKTLVDPVELGLYERTRIPDENN